MLLVVNSSCVVGVLLIDGLEIIRLASRGISLKSRLTSVLMAGKMELRNALLSYLSHACSLMKGFC